MRPSQPSGSGSFFSVIGDACCSMPYLKESCIPGSCSVCRDASRRTLTGSHSCQDAACLLKGQRYRAIVQRDPALSVTSAPLQGHPSYSSCVMLAQCDRLPLSSILLPRGPRCLQSREGDSSTHTGTYVWCVSYALGFSGNWCVGLYRWNTQGSKMHYLLGLS